MQYISTRGQAPVLNFEETLITGLASDGGLYVPETWPKFSNEECLQLKGLPYEEVAFRVMRPFIGDAFTEGQFREIIRKAYSSFSHSAKCPLVQISDREFLLELFHGPTLAFKDVAMQLIAKMFEVILKRRGSRATIVGATSGDTGSAAMEAFRGLSSVDLFILFPNGKISDVQRRQMTTVKEKNVNALTIDGDFDDCQAFVKEMFADEKFRTEVKLSGINSINWARILAQVVYFVTSSLAVGSLAHKVDFVVPTGNFGDIFAGYVAKKMGFPIGKLCIATNQNNILDRVIRTGLYEKTLLHSTISPSMDIQVSSNFERLLFDLYKRDSASIIDLMERLKNCGKFVLNEKELKKLRSFFVSGAVNEEDTLKSIRGALYSSGQLVCPHTAVGLAAIDKKEIEGTHPIIYLATAHPAKFKDAVLKATKREAKLPKHMASLFLEPERVLKLENNYLQLRGSILERVLR